MTALLLPPIISIAELHAEYPDAVICDCRAYLDERDGADAYNAGHIPGARFVDLETVLSSPPGPGIGRHPLPSPETFAEGLANIGISNDTPVVAYDDAGGMIAGRLVWMLRTLGQPAALLDGGIAAWDGELSTNPPEIVQANNAPRPWPADAIVTTEQIDAIVAEGTVVVDSRGPDRYAGLVEPIDPVAGHVPGAINLPFASNLADGYFKSSAELTQRFADIGADDDTVYYCGSGVSACNNMLAAEANGFGRGRLYVGSWSGYCTRSDATESDTPTD